MGYKRIQEFTNMLNRYNGSYRSCLSLHVVKISIIYSVLDNTNLEDLRFLRATKDMFGISVAVISHSSNKMKKWFELLRLLLYHFCLFMCSGMNCKATSETVRR